MKTQRICWLCGVVVLCGVPARAVWAVTPTPEELAQTRRWVAAEFEGVAQAGTSTAGRRAADSEPFVSFNCGDYYPLTAYTREPTAWMAWQSDRPDLGAGMVQAFRRDKSDYESVRVKLRGLDANAVYALTNLDLPYTTELTGREVLDSGLSIAIPESRGAVIITYRKAK